MTMEARDRQIQSARRSGKYVGRFAPSPTGPLHFGSLVSALGSWLDARAHGGSWSVRIEDLDRPRVVPGADESILKTLEAFSLWWDGPVVYQSGREEAYRAALEQLHSAGQLYPCGCSRNEIKRTGHLGPAGPVYPGTCRSGLAQGRQPRSWRLLSRARHIRFCDRSTAGIHEVDLESTIGDVVVHRADGLYAYHLAVVVDDAALGVSDVVRGGDLLSSTPPQILLQQLLAIPTPRYLHLPIALDAHGNKLSKQNQAPPVNPQQSSSLLHRALTFLGQAPPAELQGAPSEKQLAWATRNWRPQRLSRPCAAITPSPARGSRNEGRLC